ncbi:MAG TPA: hypothetical protein VMX56_00880 [Anaerolineales bacterium]|nr:hypothetical protein [Anaerolineales bacterium]
MVETLLIIAMIGTGVQADGWPVLWPTVPPVITPLKESVISHEVDSSNLVSHEVQDSSGVTITLTFEEPKTEETLTRLLGPSWPWPHNGCMMCLGNHMIASHGQSANYLRSITYRQWQILHDNLHNGKGEFTGVKGSNEGYIGYEAGGSSYRRRGGLFGRFRR